VDFGLTKEQKLLVERVELLVKERIAPRAAQYDLTLEAPAEDIRDLHREGWLLANLKQKRGGLGYGLYGDDPLAFFCSTNTWPMATHQPRIASRSTTMP
jgi:alkylation response protein AidB-like acyl-CoA dehydrogenase